MEKVVGHDALAGGAGKRQAGLSLVEAMAVIAVASLVVATAVMLHNAARLEQQTIQIVAEYEAIKANVKALYTGLGYGNNVELDPSLIRTRRVPSSLKVTEPDTLTNMFGGDVLVFGETEKFRISFDRLPR